MNHFTLTNFPIKNKTIFLRVDFNVPIEKKKITDDSKIIASLDTIHFLLEQDCKIILATHLGRPEGKIVNSLRLNLIARKLEELMKYKIIKLNDCIGKEVKSKIEKGKAKDIFLLENLRFYKEEEENDLTFAHSLASLANIYVNDAFAVSHRKNASVYAITQFLPSLSGLLLEKEIKMLSKALHPKKPAVWIMGGAKLNKVELIEQAFDKADYILIGGALAFAFLRAKGISVGLSKTDTESVENAKKILKHKAAKKIILPLDFLVSEKFSSRAKTETVNFNQIKSNQIALDIGPETIKHFKMYLRKAHTIVWNGPLGYFEWMQFSKGTKEIGKFIGNLTAISICGGGETVEAINKFHLQHNLSHLSTGGGASLEFLSEKKLPGIEALERSYRKFKDRV